MIDDSQEETRRCQQCHKETVVSSVSPKSLDETCGAEIICEKCRDILDNLIRRIPSEFQNRFIARYKNEDDGWIAYQTFVINVIRKAGYSQIAPDNDEFIGHLKSTVEEKILELAPKDLIRLVVWEEMQKKLHHFATNTRRDQEKKKRMKKNRQGQSLDQPNENGNMSRDGVALIDLIEARTDDGPDEDRVAKLRAAYESLLPSERLVLYLSTGLTFRNKKWTYDEIAEATGISRDNISNIKRRAVAKLKESVVEVGED